MATEGGLLGGSSPPRRRAPPLASTLTATPSCRQIRNEAGGEMEGADVF